MQKSLVLLLTTLAIFAVFLSIAHSQDFPRYEVNGGFAGVKMGDRTWIGWKVSGTRNFNRYFGITSNLLILDASKNEFIFYREYNTEARRYFFLAGAEFTDRQWNRWVPYAHALIGASVTSISYSYMVDKQFQLEGVYDKNSFTMMLGGGFKYKIKGPLGAQLFQADYIANRIDDKWDKWEDGGMVSFGLNLNW